MKYIIRSLKYFCYLICILVLIILALVLTGFVEADLSKMFVNGYDSLWQIALIMLVFAIIYPRFGFSSRTAHLFGPAEEIRPGRSVELSAPLAPVACVEDVGRPHQLHHHGRRARGRRPDPGPPAHHFCARGYPRRCLAAASSAS